MMRTAIALLGVVFWGAMLFCALPAFAQFDLSADGSSVTITANPTYPSPGETVQLTAQSPLLNLAASTITWTVNGNPAGQRQSIDVTLGSLGSETNVAVSVSGASGNDSAQLSLIPTSIDLLWESDSYTPPLYQGRSLPTPGSSIRLLAIPHFVEPDGSAVPVSQIAFTWKNNGAVVESQSGVGDSSAVIPAAILYGEDQVTVDARTLDGTLSGEAGVSARTQDPELVLYEDDPLFGIMYHQALPAQSSASESETSFVAVPYFAAVGNPQDPRLAYYWTVNGASISSDAQDPNEITVQAQNAGSAQIGVSLSEPSNPFVGATGSWSVSFASGNNSSSNAFHASVQP